MNKLIGGSFAPPLSGDKLAEYETLLVGTDPQVADAAGILLRLCRKFLETPVSTEPVKKHPSGKGLVQYLEPAEVERLWEACPWKYELDAMVPLFEGLPPSPLRNAAFHLLWYGFELTADREPCTKDRL